MDYSTTSNILTSTIVVTLEPSVQDALREYDKLKSLVATSNIMEKITYGLGLYLSIPLIIMNLIGNAANYTVFSQATFNHKISIGFYLRWLAIVGILESYVIFYIFLVKLDIEISSLSKVACDIHTYVLMTLPYYSPWFTAIVALERLVQTLSIKSIRLLTDKRFRYSTVAITFLCLSIVNVNVFVDSFFKMNNAQITTATNDSSSLSSRSLSEINRCLVSSFYASIFVYVDSMIAIILPFVLMTVANIIVAIKIKQSKTKSRVVQQHHVNTNNNSNVIKENKFLIISLSLNILFFVTHSVSVILNLYLVPFKQEYPTKLNELNSLDHSPFNLLFMKAIGEFSIYNIQQNSIIIAYYFKYIYYIIQFFLHLAINNVFRHEFITLIKSKQHIFVFKKIKF